MWKASYNNQICHNYEKWREHNQHLNRLLRVRPKIVIDEPILPSFFRIKSAKEEKEEERKNQIKYENDILYRNLTSILNKPGKYNKNVVKPKNYPAHDKYNRNQISKMKKLFDINQNNIRMYYKISTLKSNYDTNDMLKSGKMQEKYLRNISSHSHKYQRPPSLEFLSVDQLKKRLQRQINLLFLDDKTESGAVDNSESLNNNNNAIMNLPPRPQTHIPKPCKRHMYMNNLGTTTTNTDQKNSIKRNKSTRDRTSCTTTKKENLPKTLENLTGSQESS